MVGTHLPSYTNECLALIPKVLLCLDLTSAWRNRKIHLEHKVKHKGEHEKICAVPSCLPYHVLFFVQFHGHLLLVLRLFGSLLWHRKIYFIIRVWWQWHCRSFYTYWWGKWLKTIFHQVRTASFGRCFELGISVVHVPLVFWLAMWLVCVTLSSHSYQLQPLFCTASEIKHGALSDSNLQQKPQHRKSKHCFYLLVQTLSRVSGRILFKSVKLVSRVETFLPTSLRPFFFFF